MVIVKISQGLANSMYEFAAGYALSKKLNQELALDISECVISSASSWGFFLDYFNIPKCKKIVYDLQDVRHVGHRDVFGILKCIREKSQVIVDTENIVAETNVYKSIKDTDVMKFDDNIYLCGFFISAEKYCADYWDEIREIFTIKEKSEELKQFEKLIEGKISVGIHIRRGDMLLADWATRMKDEYYLAAMEAYREQFGNCIFCVFSDDIDYAKKLIGKDKSVYYIHYIGYDDAALDEFISLSMCTHRILSNSSTFSRLADELNGNESRKCFLQGIVSTTNSEDGYIKRSIRTVKDIINQIRKKDCEIDWTDKYIHIDKYIINKYAQRYKIDNADNLLDYDSLQDEVLNAVICKDNCIDMLRKIARLSLNVYGLRADVVDRLFLQKFYCHYFMQKFDNALQVAFVIYDSMQENKRFMSRYIDVLFQLYCKEEALVEAIGHNDFQMIDKIERKDLKLAWLKKALTSTKKHFVLVPYSKMESTDRILSFVEIGMILAHLGHDVTFIVDPINEGDRKQFSYDKRLKNRQGVDLSCNVLLYNGVITDGVRNLYTAFGDDEVVVISRKIELFADKEQSGSDKLVYVYWDFSSENDAETPMARDCLSAEDETNLMNSADYIVTTKSNADTKFIVWDDVEGRYDVVKEKWDFSREHRLNTRYIYAVAKMMERIK